MLRSRLAVVVLLATPLGAAADLGKTGDVLSRALPAAVLTVELVAGDREGAWQFVQSATTSLVATEILKRTVKSTRPDGSDDRSFPSGHATRAFAAAAFVHRRYGSSAAWPLYGAALVVGHSRVQAQKHRWVDVAGSAALSAASTWWLVEPARPHALSLALDPRRRDVALEFAIAF
jgi:membrane-associated phospholipid phosphatase